MRTAGLTQEPAEILTAASGLTPDRDPLAIDRAGKRLTSLGQRVEIPLDCFLDHPDGFLAGFALTHTTGKVWDVDGVAAFILRLENNLKLVGASHRLA